MLFDVAVMDGTRPWRALLIYIGVRIGGWHAWLVHARRRRAALLP
jgi:hypothetical protein